MTSRVLERPAEAVYRWSWGTAERVQVLAVNLETGAAYVEWPDSRRDVDGRTVERPTSWASVDVESGELRRPCPIADTYAGPVAS